MDFLIKCVVKLRVFSPLNHERTSIVTLSVDKSMYEKTKSINLVLEIQGGNR